MSCCSFNCPRFQMCNRGIGGNGWNAVPYAEYGTGIMRPGYNHIQYMCGPMGDYGLFEALELPLFIGWLSAEKFYIRCQTEDLSEFTHKDPPLIAAFVADKSCVYREGPPLVLKEDAFTRCLWNPHAFGLITQVEQPFYVFPEDKIQALDSPNTRR